MSCQYIYNIPYKINCHKCHLGGGLIKILYGKKDYGKKVGRYVPVCTVASMLKISMLKSIILPLITWIRGGINSLTSLKIRADLHLAVRVLTIFVQIYKFKVNILSSGNAEAFCGHNIHDKLFPTGGALSPRLTSKRLNPVLLIF